jgi:Fic family protein
MATMASMVEFRVVPRPTAALRERRLAALLADRGREADDSELRGVVEDAQILGSLELAGIEASWEEVRESRASGRGPASVLAIRCAREAVDPRAPLTVHAIRAWHSGLFGPVGFRRGARQREGAPPAPPALVESRLALLESWLESESARDLRPEQAAALALARIVEVLPFDDGNGRVSRLASSHVMVRGGRHPPILVAGDGPRLVECLQSAFRLETEPLTSLLAEASDRALDVKIQALERG